MGSEVSNIRRGTISVMRGINEKVPGQGLPGQGLPGKFTKSIEVLTVCDLASYFVAACTNIV